MTDPYVLPSGVLRNKLGVVDRALLDAVEADVTASRLFEIALTPIPGAYDLRHLCTFHAHIFGDLYDWAGQLRTVEISKGTSFCPMANLESYAAEIFGRLAAADRLRGLERGTFVTALAELHGDVNALHPFREGNGRTQRAFLGQLASEAGYRIDWSRLDPELNREASIKSFVGDNSLMEQLLDGLVGTG